MQDSFPIPSCFSSGEKFSDDPSSAAANKSGQTVVMLVYRTKISGRCRLITVTWCRNLLVHGLSVSVEGSDGDDDGSNAAAAAGGQYGCKVDLRPWYFWRKNGSKRFQVEGNHVDVFWDLRSASFSGDPEPRSDYYVAVVSGDEVVLLLGDLKKDAFRRTGCRPAFIDATLVAKKEHVFGKKQFSTRAKFHEKGKFHEISIECISSSAGSNFDPEMVIKIDGHVAIHVKHLQWKFRGNGCISVNKAMRVEVFWDVHDWLFSPGAKHALFIFKPVPSPGSSLSSSSSSSLSSLFSSVDGNSGSSGNGGGSSGFSLFLYAWKLE